MIPALPQPLDKPKIVLEDIPGYRTRSASRQPDHQAPPDGLDDLNRAAGRSGGAGGLVISPDGAARRPRCGRCGC